MRVSYVLPGSLNTEVTSLPLTSLQRGMTSRKTGASEAALIPLFLGKRSCNITFVLDTSENMRAVLGSVKRLLIQTLLTKASLRDSLFNILTYSGKVRREGHNISGGRLCRDAHCKLQTVLQKQVLGTVMLWIRRVKRIYVLL